MNLPDQTAVEFGSVCSGIEAASVAWHELGWRAAWLAEIDKFASAVLAHHYPTVPNLGDMTKIARAILVGVVKAPDVFCGGTPCQAFSVAGLRNSLDDARGNLTLTFVEIANAIDHVRTGRGEDECVIVWENVPGVLSTKDNAFGCFLGGLAGEDGPLEPPGGKWANAGAVYGPRRAVAWRTLDAQYFGVAQRRRRVLVVASAREGFDPATVLFEWDGLRRDTAPSRQAGQVAPTIPARSSGGGGLGADFDCDGGLIQAFGGNNQSGPIDVATARNACASASGRMDFETETFLVQPAHTLRGEGFDASEDGTGRGTPLVPVHCFDARQSDVLQYGDISGPLDTGFPGPAIAFDCKASGQNGFGIGEIASTMRAMGHAGSHQNGGGHQAVAYVPEVAATMVARSSRGGGQTNSPGHQADSELVASTMQVRRLTPEECEALQGIPRGYTAIPWRGKPAEQCPDGPRYKALGNSWAVPKFTWLGRRIDRALRPAA